MQKDRCRWMLLFALQRWFDSDPHRSDIVESLDFVGAVRMEDFVLAGDYVVRTARTKSSAKQCEAEDFNTGTRQSHPHRSADDKVKCIRFVEDFVLRATV
jgi:hypothetical protein